MFSYNTMKARAGTIGRNGLGPRTMPAQGGTGYNLAPGTFYRVDAASVINNTTGEPFSGAHSDIRKPRSPS